MRKLTVKKVRVISSIIMLSIVVAIAVFAFLPEKSVTIYGGENYAPIYNGAKDRAQISLMFNVYEGTSVVKDILDILDSYGAKSTFFVGGCWADDNNEMLMEIVSRGHELANHGYFHLEHNKLSLENNIKEIENNHKVVKAITGVEMNLFAPPSGAFSEKTLIAAQKLGYKTIMWSKDTIDWRDKDENLVFTRATKNVENGDLILMHPKEHTKNALSKILEFYKEKGITVVTVTQCIEGI